ncbi:50S ribosomal protein L22 [candidate division KSB1 bacterium]
MKARARSRYVRSSPRKIRQVADLIRGKRVSEALDILHFMPKKGARLVVKTVHSAVSNLMHQEGSRKLDEENLFIRQIYIDGGPIAKRFLPGPMGRANRIRKRFSHITVTISDEEE